MRTLVFSLVSFVLLADHWATAVEPSKPIRVGVLSLANYQSVAFTQLFHQPGDNKDLAGLKVVAAFPVASADIEESVVSEPKWIAQIQKYGTKIVKSQDEMLNQVDAVMIMSLDGRAHLEQAKAVIRAGKPFYIGRPMADTLDNVKEIFRLAKEAGVPCFSCSQHRYSPGFSGMRNHPEVGEVLGCDVYGGCPTEPHHPELVWHGVHCVETLFTIMGPGCEKVSRASTKDFELITGVWKDGRIGTYRGIRKGAIKYSGTVFGTKGISRAGHYGHGVPVNWVAPTKDRYMGYEGVATEIAKFFKTGKSPISPEETIEMFAFMQAAQQSKENGGTPVTIKSVLGK